MRLKATAAAVLITAVITPASMAQVPPVARPHLVAPTPTDQLMDAGLAAFHRGDHVLARQIFRQLAHREIPAAETLLGTMAANGQGGPQDDAVAAAWFIRAARRGYAPAQMALADSFSRGRGVKQDRGRALQLARAAAIQGQPGATQFVARHLPSRARPHASPQVELVSARP